ncbi:MAG: hypothetical protein AAGD35_09875 [Actinomycetota bacterium]
MTDQANRKKRATRASLFAALGAVSPLVAACDGLLPPVNPPGGGGDTTTSIISTLPTVPDTTSTTGLTLPTTADPTTSTTAPTTTITTVPTTGGPTVVTTGSTTSTTGIPTVAERAVEAFFDAGYDYDDAVRLAEYWGYPNVYDAKVTKGQVILGLIGFPPPAGTPPLVTPLGAFFNAGYDYEDAVRLAEYWGYLSASEAKTIKGKVILGIIEFPAENSAPPVAEQAVGQFLQIHDYYDAEVLAELWGYGEPFDAKVAMGKVMFGVAELPPIVVDEERFTELMVDVFTAHNGTYELALELADRWGLDDPIDAKIIKAKTMIDLGDDILI